MNVRYSSLNLKADIRSIKQQHIHLHIRRSHTVLLKYIDLYFLFGINRHLNSILWSSNHMPKSSTIICNGSDMNYVSTCGKLEHCCVVLSFQTHHGFLHKKHVLKYTFANLCYRKLINKERVKMQQLIVVVASSS